MPRQDGTGPFGKGPSTGKGLGLCGNGNNKGFGRRFGRGCGSRQMISVGLTKEDQKRILEAELKEIESEKQNIEKKLKDME